jgi:DNA-binding IclR family transcriptional regulator
MKMASLKKVKSAERTLDLIETLASTTVPMGTGALSEALKIPKSSLFHLLGTLEDRGYVREENGGYVIGPKLTELARGHTEPRDLSRIVAPVLQELGAAINETCSLNIQRGDNVEVVATVSGRQALNYTMQLGELAPLYAVSAGKALLATWDNDRISSYLERITFERFTPHTIQSPERLWRDIERARTEGFGFVEEEFTPGIVGLGVALPHGSAADHFEPAALNVAIPSVRCDAQKLVQIRQQLRIAANRAAAALGRAEAA